MPIYAELHDGRRLEFPDGTDAGVVQTTVKRVLGQGAPADSAAAAEVPGVGESMLIAAGRGTDKLVQGVRQAYNAVTGDKTALDQMAAAEAEKDRLFKPVKQAHPIATSFAENAPLSLATGMVTGGTSLLAGAAAAGLPSLLSYGTPEERAKRAAVDAAGGATGVAAGKLISRLLKPAGAASEVVPDTALEAAKRIGYQPTPAQIANSPALGNIENYLLRNPGGSGTMQKVVTANQQALNRAGAKAMGETADNLGEGVLAAAKNRIGGEFDRLAGVTKPQLGNDFLNSLVQIDSANVARGSFANSRITGLVDKGLELAAQGKLTGTAYKEIRTELANQAQAAFKAGDATMGQAYKTVVGALDDAAKASLSPADRQAWDVARQQWTAFKTLSKGNVAEGGNVSAARVASALRAKNPNFRTGGVDGEIADIARVGEAFKSVPNPNSGNQVASMMFGNPFTGVPMMAGNKLAAMLYTSPVGQQYFSRGLVPMNQMTEALLGRAGNVGAVPVARQWLGAE